MLRHGCLFFAFGICKLKLLPLFASEKVGFLYVVSADEYLVNSFSR